MRMSKKIILLAFLGAVVLAALYILQPPKDGEVVNYRSSNTALGSTTVLLLKSGECLVISDSEVDIGQTEATQRRNRPLYQIALNRDVDVWQNGGATGLQQSDGDVRVVPGQPFEAVINFKDKPNEGILREIWDFGWPLNAQCGERIAVVSNIISVQDRPQPRPVR